MIFKSCFLNFYCDISNFWILEIIMCSVHVSVFAMNELDIVNVFLFDLVQIQSSCGVCDPVQRDLVSITCGHSLCLQCISFYRDQSRISGGFDCPRSRKRCRTPPVLQTQSCKMMMIRNKILVKLYQTKHATFLKQYMQINLTQLCSLLYFLIPFFFFWYFFSWAHKYIFVFFHNFFYSEELLNYLFFHYLVRVSGWWLKVAFGGWVRVRIES